MKKKTIELRIDRCMACRNCELACAIAHSVAKDLAKAVQDGENPGHRIYIESYGSKAVPVHCNHCEEAACMMACPTGAIHRNGHGKPVLVDKERCIGCRMCVQACPFGVITMSPDGKGVLKCDQCVERLARGQEPACVNACPTKALQYVDVEDANRSKRQKVAGKVAAASESGKKSE